MKVGIALACGLLMLMIVAAVAVVFQILRVEPDPIVPIGRPVAVRHDGYVASDTCRECHAEHYESWHASYHRTMTQTPSAEAILGDFGGAEVNDGAITYRFTEAGGDYWVEEYDGRSGLLRSRKKIVLATGSHHMQVYWTLAGRGRALDIAPYVYHFEESRWRPRKSLLLMLDQTLDHSGRWNAVCSICHTTHPSPRVGENYRESPPATVVAEFGIACEACHGPGEHHVRHHRGLADAGDSALVVPSELPAGRSSQICGQCHSVFELTDGEREHLFDDGPRYRPGDDLESTRPVRVHPGDATQFWPDGMVRVSGREYSGLIQSPCYRGGEFSCLSCHQMHQAGSDSRDSSEWANDQLRIGMEGNSACVACHRDFESEETLRGHTHHSPASTGSQCYNCHMPHTTYGLVKAIRSHQISSPNLNATLLAGRPNACNLCHLDQTLRWTSANLHNWYEQEEPKLDGEEETIAASVLWLLKGDAGLRALAAWSYGWQAAMEASPGEWRMPLLALLLTDPYDAVRYIAYRSLSRQPDQESMEYDFLGSETHRRGSQALLLLKWRSKSKDVPLGAEALLLDEQGDLNETAAREILSRRNDRRVHLNE